MNVFCDSHSFVKLPSTGKSKFITGCILESKCVCVGGMTVYNVHNVSKNRI